MPDSVRFSKFQSSITRRVPNWTSHVSDLIHSTTLNTIEYTWWRSCNGQLEIGIFSRSQTDTESGYRAICTRGYLAQIFTLYPPIIQSLCWRRLCACVPTTIWLSTASAIIHHPSDHSICSTLWFIHSSLSWIESPRCIHSQGNERTH